jgi:hypothetical protein
VVTRDKAVHAELQGASDVQSVGSSKWRPFEQIARLVKHASIDLGDGRDNTSGQLVTGG